MKPMCGSLGWAGPSGCILDSGHEGGHQYGDTEKEEERRKQLNIQELEQQLAASQAFDAEWLHDDGENLSAYNKAKAIFCRAEKRLNASQIALRIKNEEHKCCTEDLIALRKQLHKARRGD